MAITSASPPQRQGLDAVVTRVLSQRVRVRPSVRGVSFGAAGPRGLDLDPEMTAVIVAKRKSTFAPDPRGRMLSTDLGQRAYGTVGNESRTLAAVDRLALEVLARSLLMTGQARDSDRLLVMRRADDQPPVLLRLSPEVASAGESKLISDDVDLPFPILLKALQDAADPGDKTPEAATFRALLDGGPGALAEAFLISQPEVVLTRRPRMVRLCVPAPPMRVEAAGRVSTAGVLCRHPAGGFGVTGCYHGTGPVGTPVLLDHRLSEVKDANVVQDIVFIPLPAGCSPPSMVGLGGILEDREPARADRVRFDGMTNQNRSTRVISADAGLTRARPTVQLKVQTGPDTDEGDSGSALIDEQDRVIGFAFERTAYDDFPQFTDWIWAANALRALRLEPYKRGV